VPPLVCFAICPLVQIYMFAFRSRGKASLPYFGNVRTHWAVEMHNTGDVAAMNTIRDFLKVTSWLTANAVLAASILVTFTYTASEASNRIESSRADSACPSRALPKQTHRTPNPLCPALPPFPPFPFPPQHPTRQIFSTHCGNQSLSGCDPRTLYLVAQLVVLIVNFFFVALHMLTVRACLPACLSCVRVCVPERRAQRGVNVTKMYIQ
jgi:hypothetical protein